MQERNGKPPPGRLASLRRSIADEGRIAGHGPGRLVAWLAALAMGLAVLQSVLRSQSGYGIEELLGWSAVGEQTAALLQLWRDSHRLGAAWLYLVADSVLFVPTYCAFLLTVAPRLVDRVAGDDDPAGFSPGERAAWTAGAALALGLVAVDLVENGLGLGRMGPVGIALGVVATAGAVVRLRPVLAQHLPPWRLARWAVLGAAAFALVPLVASLLAGGSCRPAGPGLEAWVARLGCASHRAKLGLSWAVMALVLLSTVGWVFGLRLRLRRRADPGAQCAVAERARLRAAMWDVLWRSRYVLVAIAAIAGLLLRMDQGRDLLYAMAAAPFRREAEGGPPWLGATLAWLATGGALWLLVFTCWFWTRSVCQVQSARSQRLGQARRSSAERLAGQEVLVRSWARLLGVAPALVFASLCVGVIQDCVAPAGKDAWAWLGPVVVIVVAGLGSVVLGLLFLRDRSQQPDARYYDFRTWRRWFTLTGGARLRGPGGRGRRRQTGRKYRFLGVVGVAWLPPLLCAGILLCRGADALHLAWNDGGAEYVPLALPGVLLAVALWLCFLGWLSIAEEHRSIPWVPILIAVAGVVGAMGWTRNHVVWPPVAAQDADPRLALLRMLGFTVPVMLILLLGYARILRGLRDGPRRPSGGASGEGRRWRGLLRPGGVAFTLGLMGLALAGVLALADQLATSRPAAADEVPSPAGRPSLDQALADWLLRLCRASPDCASPSPAGGGGPVPVYFVSSEGGGIRAAAWTTFVLDRLMAEDPGVVGRTFSISGVSGGAVGAAVFRTCQDLPEEGRRRCVRRFAQADLLSPLLSAWTFEDALARLVPTSGCRTPGCGFLSRDAWFEQAMELGAPGLRHPLAQSGEALRGQGGWAPYLLLNATWVESGERAIASDLAIDQAGFPAARDVLDIAGTDLTLSAAAHGAARFPYINAIGVLRGAPDRCPESARDPRALRTVCGHLADGGYFDNSGAQSTRDVLQGLAACLAAPADPPPEPGVARASSAAARPGCRQLPPAQRDWLRAHLVPQVLMIRNGVDPGAGRQELCRAAWTRGEPDAQDVVPAIPGCSGLLGHYHPDRPICREQSEAFIDALGPAVALLGVSGVGAAGRLGEARQVEAVERLRQAMGGLAAATDLHPVQVLDLFPDGVRYPLGWHLSGVAVEGMIAQARGCALEQPRGSPAPLVPSSPEPR